MRWAASSFDNLRPLLDLRENAPPLDNHLVYVLRMAIRDHCKVPGMLPQLAKSDLSTIMSARSWTSHPAWIPRNRQIS